MATHDTMSDLDAEILDELRAAGLSDVMIVGAEQIDGYYTEDGAEQGDGEMAVLGTYHEFDAAEDDLAAKAPGLAYDDVVEVSGRGQFRVLRTELGDPGRTLVILGKIDA